MYGFLELISPVVVRMQRLTVVNKAREGHHMGIIWGSLLYSAHGPMLCKCSDPNTHQHDEGRKEMTLPKNEQETKSWAMASSASLAKAPFRRTVLRMAWQLPHPKYWGPTFIIIVVSSHDSFIIIQEKKGVFST